MNISLIAAIALDKVIGLKNKIPWTLSDDLVWFKHNTLNKPVIMGYMTYKSIGKPLVKRLNIVLSYTRLSNDKDIILVNSVDEALAVAGKAEEIMIIGGKKIYELFLPLANRLYLTHIDIKVIGDTYFPIYEPNEWNSIFTEYHESNEKKIHNYYFEILERRFKFNKNSQL
ncbi:MAG: type 3 dihydrofolate reductase [Arsenophonus sp. ET-YP4-MAG3]